MHLRSRTFLAAALAAASLVFTATPSSAITAAPGTTAATRPAFDTRHTPPAPVQHSALIPELPDGVGPETSAAAALVTTAPACPSLRYCAWTGGYFTGPSVTFTAGYSYNWADYGQTACAKSGTSGARWSNCASSTRNRSAYATAYYFAQASGSGFTYTEGPGKPHETLGVFNNNVESSVAA